MAIYSRLSVQNFDNWWFWIRKNKRLLNLIKEQDDIEPKYEYLIKKHEKAGIKHFNDPNAFIKCSNTMDDIYENIDDYSSYRQRKILIVFDDMIADI